MDWWSRARSNGWSRFWNPGVSPRRRLRHVGEGVFAGLPNPLQATRYHSLVVSPEGLPDELVTTTYSDEGEIMALRHRTHPIVGVQFHLEAVLTRRGHELLRNFLPLAGEHGTSCAERSR